MNFWEKMKRPILCLAPMADVTDAAFRHIIAKVSKEKPKAPFEEISKKDAFGFSSTYVTYTEFVSADGLIKASESGRKKLLKDLEYSEIEKPIIAQFFTSQPEMMEKAAALAIELGFNGVDINMGCPDKSIEKQGAGAALMKSPKLAREIIIAAKQGVKNKIPVSVKTRLGYNRDELESWLPELLTENPAAIIIHARTRKEMSKAPAKWERIKKAVEIRDEVSKGVFWDRGISKTPFDTSKTLIIGNGDIEDVNDAIKKCEESGVDGAMLGRAVFGNPWLFAGYEPGLEERLQVLVEHTKLFEEKFKGVKSFAIMKKHFKEYLKGPSLRDLKYKLMRTENAREIEEIVKNYLPVLLAMK